MCGLVAILTKDKDIFERTQTVKNMLSTIQHRGPDDEGIIHIHNKAIFGHRRLKIIDIVNGAQPMCTSDGRYTLIFNGEIYNYIELSEQLTGLGVHLKTGSDTEVLLNLLILKGADAISELNGMFAFVFHDNKENKWIAARDHFGIKPLYFAKASKELIFASEIKAFFAHPDITPTRDNRALQQYLSLQFCLDNRTLFKDIVKVRPSTFIVGSGEDIAKEVSYWEPNYNVDSQKTEKEFSKQLSFYLKDSIRMQMRSMFLSADISRWH